MPSSTVSFLRTIFDDDGNEDDVEIKVEFDFRAGSPASLRGHPDNWTPADSSDYDITAAFDDAGNPTELTADEERMLADEIMEAIENHEPDFNEPDEGNDHFDYPDCY